ncbi:hypothetical protein J5Y04_02670 [Kitasatospora sp. RG8]|uniref:hypothetical protein n=1 Tax=Kitasatospora sp. RG8 TaxID=2820815 RepID=UPI001AE079BE|nr:hypothetical protein [Kitasatospora sp. RG8]MBP0448456.1 hypothetical protein [Kitasatospora sp. RG8]
MTAEGPLTDDELTAIERRAAAAAPGPWKAHLEGQGIGGESFIQVRPDADPDDEIYVRRYVGNAELGSRHPELHADLEFIASARSDVPRLVAEVRRLQGALARQRRW